MREGGEKTNTAKKTGLIEKHHKEKSALFICVYFPGKDCKRYQGGDSNHTIYIEQPYSVGGALEAELLVCPKFTHSNLT